MACGLRPVGWPAQEDQKRLIEGQAPELRNPVAPIQFLLHILCIHEFYRTRAGFT